MNQSLALSGLTIRSADRTEEAEVTTLWRICNLVLPDHDPLADFRFALANDNATILVGIDMTARIVGSVMVGHDGHRGWIYFVACDPGRRRQGIGRSMVEAAEAWLRSKGVAKMMLLVRETNTQVVDFYRRIGFEALPRVVMQKPLRPASGVTD